MKITDLFSSIIGTKECSACKQYKTYDEFYKQAGRKPRAICISCYSVHNKEQRKKHSEKRRSYDKSRGTGWGRSDREKYELTKREKHDSYLRRTYNITIDEYEELFESQGNVCAICKCECNRSTTTRLCVDHCHKTGKIRGLLCFQCNVGLGKFKDDVALIKEAAIYLERTNA